MTTFLDIGLLESFSPVFSFLFVWVAVFAILEYTKLFTENKGIHAMIAFILAILTLMSGKLVELISILAPAFVVAMIFLMFLFLIYKMFGVEENWFKEAITEKTSVYYWVLIIVAVILIGSVSYVFGPQLLEITQGTSATGNETGISQNIGAAIFHPKVLGFVFIMAIAIFTILQLASEAKKK
ncbi:hypothetical protein KY308_03290 [Candidatus Woesearchaeota archaeon]|nr:hypothetical protein [Candidatus Woesearchaeota archaeon]